MTYDAENVYFAMRLSIFRQITRSSEMFSSPPMYADKGSLLKQSLVSFTYIPGTVIYAGYGSAFEKLEWGGQNYRNSSDFLETKRGFFFKVSYLWRF